MILSDREIQAAIARKAIFIKPCPLSDSPRWSSTALDLTLDSEIRPWEEIESVGEDNTIDPTKEGFDSNALAVKYTESLNCNSGYILKPKKFILGWTVEKIKSPHTSKIAARVEGKSSLARIGLGVHVTAPTIHAGFGYNEA
jgi:dCTP deaminase